MGSKDELTLSIDEIENLNLEEAEEKLLYIRYLIRREQKEYKLIKFQYFIEYLERRIQLLATEKNTVNNLASDTKSQAF